MWRNDIINYLIKTKKFKNYLEIGVRIPDECFNKIECPTKHSVDPGHEKYYDPKIAEEYHKITYKFTSDKFFELLDMGSLDLNKDYKWDIIFIDGLHLAEQVEKDILNSLKHLSPSGIIVIHDINPATIHTAREDYQYKVSTNQFDKVTYNFNLGYWNGTVWKTFYKMRTTRPDLEMYSVNTKDMGVGIIKKGSQECCEFDNPFYEFNKFAAKRNYYLNLITIEEFLTKEKS
jgi:hypothetical protein